MSSAIRIRNPRGELVEPAHFSASDAKNGFGRILDRVVKEGGVAITKRNEPFAVVISIETYQRLAGAEARTLDTLSEEFDALLCNMQVPGAAAAMQKAFDMTPEELGRAAVRQATVGIRRRAAAKHRRGGKPAVYLPHSAPAKQPMTKAAASQRVTKRSAKKVRRRARG
jgi:antitoxin Phd